MPTAEPNTLPQIWHHFLGWPASNLWSGALCWTMSSVGRKYLVHSGVDTYSEYNVSAKTVIRTHREILCTIMVLHTVLHFLRNSFHSHIPHCPERAGLIERYSDFYEDMVRGSISWHGYLGQDSSEVSMWLESHSNI